MDDRPEGSRTPVPCLAYIPLVGMGPQECARCGWPVEAHDEVEGAEDDPVQADPHDLSLDLRDPPGVTERQKRRARRAHYRRKRKAAKHVKGETPAQQRARLRGGDSQTG